MSNDFIYSLKIALNSPNFGTENLPERIVPVPVRQLQNNIKKTVTVEAITGPLKTYHSFMHVGHEFLRQNHKRMHFE